MLFIFNSACQRRPILIRPDSSEGQDASKAVLRSKASKAPWEIWTIASYTNKDYLTAARFEDEGNLDGASDYLSKALANAKTSEEAETYLLLLTSIDLKSGSGDKALTRISKYASKRRIDASQLDSRFSLLTSYCYISKNNADQALAWLVQTFKSGHGVGKISEEARRIAREYIRTQSPVELNDLQSKWNKDSFVSSNILEEKNRRMQGGAIYSKNFFNKYFTRTNYELNSAANFEEHISDTQVIQDPVEKNNTVTNAEEVKIGALLPISGQYASHAKKVEEGIRLALRESGLEKSLVVYDSNSNIIDTYNKLVNQDKVKVIFGPMLVKDVETLSNLQSNLTVPFVTYAKKRGLPGLSPQIFRLGGTPENQLQSLLVFADTKLGSKKIALLYPEGEVGTEFNEAFQAIKVREDRGTMASFQYQSRNLSQIDGLRDQLTADNFDSVILADALPGAEPILRSLRESANPNGMNILGVSLLAEASKISSYQTITEGMYLVSLFNDHSKNSLTSNFVEEYKKAFGSEPDLLAAQSYDSVKFALPAIRDGSSAISESLLKSSQILGVTGTMHILSDGEIHRDLPILKVVAGSMFEVGQ